MLNPPGSVVPGRRHPPPDHRQRSSLLRRRSRVAFSSPTVDLAGADRLLELGELFDRKRHVPPVNGPSTGPRVMTSSTSWPMRMSACSRSGGLYVPAGKRRRLTTSRSQLYGERASGPQPRTGNENRNITFDHVAHIRNAVAGTGGVRFQAHAEREARIFLCGSMPTARNTFRVSPSRSRPHSTQPAPPFFVLEPDVRLRPRAR